MNTQNLIILGTSHISRDSINKVREIIEKEQPKIICLELDRDRFIALRNQKKEKFSWIGIRRIGVKGWLFMVLASWAEKKLGKMVGTTPGEEMLAAIKEAEKNNLHIEFVDQEIEITLKRFSKAITWREKSRFVWDLITTPFQGKKLKFDLKTVPKQELIDEMMTEVKTKYPNVYRVLVEERNVVIAKNIAKAIKKFPDKKIFAIIGAGHEEVVLDMVKNKFE